MTLVLMHLINPIILAPKFLPLMVTKEPHTSAGDKCNTMTPKSGSKPSPVQHQKKKRRVLTNDTVKRSQLDMGMFWLSNLKMKMNKIFSRDLRERVCIQFFCRGRECRRDPDIICPSFSSEDLKLETIELIEDHFLAKKVGWFN
jgi:hypothetical protein